MLYRLLRGMSAVLARLTNRVLLSKGACFVSNKHAQGLRAAHSQT